MNERALRGFLTVVALLVAFGAGAFCFGGSGPGDVEHAHAEGEVWTCSMHPQIRQDGPGPCPLCGMDLIPATTASSASMPDRVVLSERARILSRLRTTAVQRQADAAHEVRLLGRIEPDESTRRNVTTWVGGRIDRLHVNTTGELVRPGQVIATLYSPEVYTAHQDLLTAGSQVKRLAGAAPSALLAAQAALSAAEDRLRLLGVPADELKRLAALDTPTQSIAIRSPFGGTVIERVATEGAYVQTGAPLYRLADLDRLWVQLDAYERDLNRLAVGQEVAITVDGVTETLTGRISFIDPTLDAQRRTSRVRVEVGNENQQLRPGMFATAVVASTVQGAAAPLVIPETAALFTGKRSVVYVEVDRDGVLGYEPRVVRLGPLLGVNYPVVAGLSEGERVVSRGAFAVDADLQIQGGRSMMATPDDDLWGSVQPLEPAELALLRPVVEAYLEVQVALAQDDLETAKAAAQALEGHATGTTFATEAVSRTWNPMVDALRSSSVRLAGAADLPEARGAFEPLSAMIQGLLRTFGNPLDEELHVAYCPMAKSNEGASWVQRGLTVDNAYFGAMMRTCGEIRSDVGPGGFLPAGRP